MYLTDIYFLSSYLIVILSVSCWSHISAGNQQLYWNTFLNQCSIMQEFWRMFSHLNILHEVKVYVQKYRQQNVLKILVKMLKISLCSRFSRQRYYVFPSGCLLSMHERLRSIFMLQRVELEVDLKQDYVDIGILCDLAPPYKNLRCVTVVITQVRTH